MNDSIDNLLVRAAAILRSGGEVMACLLVKARGSTPQSAGALMIVDGDANTHGTIGGGCVEAEVRRQTHALMAEGRTGLLKFKLDHDYGWDDGLICGGTIELAIGRVPSPEVIDEIVADLKNRKETKLALTVETEAGPATFALHLPPRERLYIAGAGHVGQALARLASRLEFEVSLFDDREDLLIGGTPPGCRAVPGEIADELQKAPIDDRTLVVVVTRGHRHDEQALAATVDRGAAYVGMIGSRRKVKLIIDDLKQRGIDDGALQSVHAPIGLEIGAISVEEIALSIAAQLVQTRRLRGGSSVHCVGQVSVAVAV